MDAAGWTERLLKLTPEQLDALARFLALTFDAGEKGVDCFLQSDGQRCNPIGDSSCAHFVTSVIPVKDLD